MVRYGTAVVCGGEGGVELVFERVHYILRGPRECLSMARVYV